MGLLDRLLGREDRSRGSGQQAWNGPGQQARPAPRTDDEQAIERYRYLLRTAPPDQVEQAHAEAFATLTPDQRRQVLADLSAGVPEGERATSDDPRSLARMATWAEMRRPGTMERTLGRGGGMGMGGLIAGGLLASVAGAFVGTPAVPPCVAVRLPAESEVPARVGFPCRACSKVSRLTSSVRSPSRLGAGTPQRPFRQCSRSVGSSGNGRPAGDLPTRKGLLHGRDGLPGSRHP